MAGAVSHLIGRSAELANLADFTLSNGVYSWFSDPRAMSVSGRALIAGVSTTGDIKAWHCTTVSPSPVTLSAAFEIEDHDNPGFLRRASDGKLMAWYSKHIGADYYQQVSTNPNDPSSWAAATNLDSTFGLAGYTYANPVQLTGETNDPIYLFFRAVVTAEAAFHYSKSTDDGATWGTPIRLFTGTYFYIRVIENGDDRIDVCIAQHPDPATGSGTSSMYHIYYEGGTWQEIGGAPLTLPITPGTDLTPIWDGTTSAGNAWINDIAIVSGNPVIAYTVYPTPSNPRYRYARWDGAAWDDNEIAPGGGPRMAPAVSQEPYYTGGLCIDSGNPNVVYFGQMYIEDWRIIRAVTADGGATWTQTKLADAVGAKAFNPFIVRGQVTEPRLAYLDGTYEGGTSYNTDIKMIGSGAGGTVPTPEVFAVTRAPLRRTTGNQDIIIPGFGTPKAARFTISGMSPNGSVAALTGSAGATDGTSQWCCAIATRDAIAATTATRTWRRATTDSVAIVMNPQNGAIVAEAAFVAFIDGGVRINISANSAGGNYSLMVELFGGADLTAKAGTQTLTTQNNSVTLTPGFQTNALFMESHLGAFNDSPVNTTIFSTGFASYDGSTIRQCSTLYRSEAGSPTQTSGETRTNGVGTFGSSRYAELATITSTQFNLTSRGADLSSITVGYLALNFGGEHQAWAGVLDTPTATGNHDFTGPSFTPLYATLRPNMIATVDTNQTDGTASAFAICTVTAQAEFSNHWRDQDNVTTVAAKTEVDKVAVNMSDHAGTTAFDATFNSFISTGVRLNFTAANGTVRKWPALFIG